MRRILLLASGMVFFTTPGTMVAQVPSDTAPQRPTLARDADTNSALAYYTYGVARLAADPDEALAAFYWASRLDPGWAAPLYGRYAALLLTQPSSKLTGYFTDRRVARRDPALRSIDSVAYLALLKNPLVDRRLDGIVVSTWLARETGNQTTLRDLGMDDRRFTAWAAYTRGDYRTATAVFAEVIKRHPDDPDLRLWRAFALFAQGQLDSARACIQQALTIERTTEDVLPGVGWVSHVLDEYSIGSLFALSGQPDSARGAYERALLDDVAFHPAHHQLGRLRLTAHDTAGALAEFNQAVGLAPNDPTYLYDLGMLLTAAGRPDSGSKVLERAAAAEPFFALPHYALGIIDEQGGFRAEAIEHFTAFVRLAPRTMGPAIASATKHLEALQGSP
jgi:tetratricopeptide (TPR) repeat protein